MKSRILLVLLLLMTSWLSPPFLSASPSASKASPLFGPVTVHFLKGTAVVDDKGQEELKKLAHKLTNLQIKTILVEGFSDNMALGSKNPYASNSELAKARADSVVLLLTRQGHIAKGLFKSIGQGAKRPLASNDSAAGRATNRRAEVRVFGQLNNGAERQKLISLSLRDVSIAAACEMLAKSNRVNIVLDKGVRGKVNLNLFDVKLPEALNIIAASGGFAVDKNKLGYLIHPIIPALIPPEIPIVSEVRTYKIRYSPVDKVEKALSKHLSENGEITALKDRNLLIIKETPAVLDKIAKLLENIDKEPQEFLIEAKILEISLDDTESFGLDWAKIFKPGDKFLGLSGINEGSIGVNGLNNSETGFIFHLINDNVNITLNALNEKGRVKTLSTPKLLTIENQKASVIIGDRKGYNVTTTINQVTTTSVEFLESGIILDVTPSIDSNGRILLIIHPEVSSGSVTSGIPSQTTTEVTTRLLADDGQTVFIGGLLKHKSDSSKSGVPVLGDIPVLGRIFSNSRDQNVVTETVVLITPHIITNENTALYDNELNKVKTVEQDEKLTN